MNFPAAEDPNAMTQTIFAGEFASYFIDHNKCVWELAAAKVEPYLISVLPPITALAVGEHNLFLDHEGIVLGTGYTRYGALGSKLLTRVTTPIIIPRLPILIIAVAAGPCFSLFLDGEGIVWGCGNNKFGVLGNPSKLSFEVTQPQRLEGLPSIQNISAGSEHALYLDINHSVWSSGYNLYGQLGIAATVVNEPVNIATLPDIQKISAGGNFSIFLDYEGNVWVCGENGDGQLGLGNYLQRREPAQIADIPPIQSISAGFRHALFIDPSKTVWCCGCNDQAQLGVDKSHPTLKPLKIVSLQNIVSVSAGAEHSLFLDVDEVVWGCGRVGGTVSDSKFVYLPHKLSSLPPIPAHVHPKSTKSARKLCENKII